jgi:hypothetical protein
MHVATPKTYVAWHGIIGNPRTGWPRNWSVRFAFELSIAGRGAYARGQSTDENLWHYHGEAQPNLLLSDREENSNGTAVFFSTRLVRKLQPTTTARRFATGQMDTLKCKNPLFSAGFSCFFDLANRRYRPLSHLS